MGFIVKLLPLVLLAYGWHRAPTSVRTGVTSLRAMPDVLRTTTKLAAAQRALAFEYLNNDRWPADVEGFLNHSVTGPVEPGRDAWGTPFFIANPFTPEASIVACGPDRECDTEDDLAMRLIPKKKLNEGDNDS